MFSPRKQELQRILDELGSPDKESATVARRLLLEFPFSTADLPLLYQALQRSYPDDMNQAGMTCARHALLQVLWETHDSRTAPFLATLYPTLPPNREIRFSALRALTEIGTKEALTLFVDLLSQGQPALGDSLYPVLLPLYKKRPHPTILFPTLLDLLGRGYYAADIYELAAHYAQNDLIPPYVWAPYHSQAVADYAAAHQRRINTEALSHQATDDAYDHDIEMMADIIRCLGAYRLVDQTRALLQEATGDKSGYVALPAITALIWQGEPVSTEAITAVAANPEHRLELFDTLNRLGEMARFPTEYLNQPAFAEADLVRWLCFPTEFGRPPDQIALLATRKVELDNEPGRVFLYQYLYRDDPDGWMVGLSGPQPLDPDEVVTRGYLTFSHFEPLDHMSIADHFESFLRPEDDI